MRQPISGVAAVNGTNLYYEVSGAGSTIVFLHDGLLDSRIWDEQQTFFAQSYRVIRYDARGYGKSETPHTKYSETQDLFTLLQFLEVSKAILVGCSNGGKIAVDFALVYPDRVEALVLVAPFLSGFNFSEEKRQRISAIWSAGREEQGVTKVVENWLNDQWWSPAPEKIVVRQKIHAILTEKLNAFLATPNFRIPIEPPAIERLEQIKVPALLVIGADDDADNKAIIGILAKGLADSQQVVISAVGHLVSMEAPDEFNQVVLDFLKSVS